MSAAIARVAEAGDMQDEFGTADDPDTIAYVSLVSVVTELDEIAARPMAGV
jgi:hypothetical protein